jgi:uncharacterized protein (TIRG00374 family)
MKTRLKKDFRFWLNIITIVALGFLIVISWDQIKEAFGKVDSLNVFALLLMIPAQLVSYYAVARLYRDFFVAQGDKIRIRTMFKIALELNFINHVFPSGGVSGFSYLSLRLRKFGISTAKSTLAQLLRFALTFLSFLALVFFGMVVLSFGSDTNPLLILISSTIIFVTIFGTVIAMYIISKPSRIKAFVSWLPRALNALLRIFHVTKREIINIEKVESTLEDLHQDYVLLRQNMQLVKRLMWWALLINIMEILTVYLVYIAFGELINPGAVIIAYAVANFAGLIAVLPGGVGVYEGLMTAVLTSAGVNKGLALSATVIYRVLQMMFFLPIGYYFYNRALRSNDELRQEQEDAPHINA